VHIKYRVPAAILEFRGWMSSTQRGLTDPEREAEQQTGLLDFRRRKIIAYVAPIVQVLIHFLLLVLYRQKF